MASIVPQKPLITGDDPRAKLLQNHSLVGFKTGVMPVLPTDSSEVIHRLHAVPGAPEGRTLEQVQLWQAFIDIDGFDFIVMCGPKKDYSTALAICASIIQGAINASDRLEEVLLSAAKAGMQSATAAASEVSSPPTTPPTSPVVT